MSLNLYATLAQLKAALDITATTWDSLLLQTLSNASRLIDAATGRIYYPEYAVDYFDGSGGDRLWLTRPLLDASEVALSSDLGATYTALTANTDYWTSNGKHWHKTPYQLLVMNPNGSYGTWYAGPRTVRITGTWGWRPNYSMAWENTADTVLDTSLAAATTQITVASVDGVDGLGLTPRFAAGNLIRIETELCAVTAVTTTKLTVVRGVNGTTAATHATGTAITRWRPFQPVEQATLTQAARFFKRAQQAYADAGANYELGQLVYAKRLDPDVEVILLEAGLKRLCVG